VSNASPTAHKLAHGCKTTNLNSPVVRIPFTVFSASITPTSTKRSVPRSTVSSDQRELLICAPSQLSNAGNAYTGSSTDLIVWALTNTSSLNTASPALSLSTKVLTVGQYGIPPKQQQPGSSTLAATATAQGFCINDTITATIAGTGCWRLLFGGQPAHDEVISRPDSNDTRMQQVMYANGKLWGALDTALNPDGGPQRAGIEWFIVNPSPGKLTMQGYLGAAGYDFVYPAIGLPRADAA
jgi:hypothetical protein